MSTHISEDKPNNQVKLSNVVGASLPPGHLKCNILKGLYFLVKFILKTILFCKFTFTELLLKKKTIFF